MAEETSPTSGFGIGWAVTMSGLNSFMIYAILNFTSNHFPREYVAKEDVRWFHQ